MSHVARFSMMRNKNAFPFASEAKERRLVFLIVKYSIRIHVKMQSCASTHMYKEYSWLICKSVVNFISFLTSSSTRI